MREILFRAWDKYDKKMYKVESINFNCFGEIETITVFENDSLLKSYNKNHNVEEHNINALVLCEYTGLTDKNGVKIFGEDVIRATEYLKPGEVNLFYKAEYIKSLAKYVLNPIVKNEKYDNNNFELDMYYYKQEDIEIIGNIFDKEKENENN